MVGRKIWIRLIKAKSTLLFVGLLAGSIAIGQAQAAPFTMTCQSGGKMKLQIDEAKNYGNGKRELNFKLYFKKASKGVNDRRPGRGECAWPHRRLNNKEKSPLNAFSTSGNLTGELTINGYKMKMSKLKPDMKKLLSYVRRPKRVFSMVVSLNSKNRLIIEKVH